MKRGAEKSEHLSISTDLKLWHYQGHQNTPGKVFQGQTGINTGFLQQ
jgi:hypothetical protein